MRVIDSSCLLLFFCLVIGSYSQTFLIHPENNYNSTFASSRACFSNCQFCQILTNQCQQCLSPYFQKDSTGTCVLITGYTIESSLDQDKSGQSFVPSPQSWSKFNTTQCRPKQNYTGNLTILGPFSMADGTITYTRTVSTHRYLIVKFFFLKMNWQADSSMQIVIMNQNNNILSNETITYSSTVPLQQLCSNNSADQRYSLTYTFSDTVSTQILISFVPKFSNTNARWGISTFLVLSGKCDQSCQNCQFSLDPSKCTSCKNFLIKASSGLCSQCQQGFYLSTISGTLACQKCPIQYKQCVAGSQICFYQTLIPKQLNRSDCTFNSSRNYYVSQYYVNTDQFVGSLFTVGGISSTYQCGSYSVVGLAKQGQGITRLISNLNPHSAVSFTFNVFKVDQQFSGQNVFQIYLDNQLVDTLFLNMAAVSNICGDSNHNEVFTTYPATAFFKHNSVSNVNITIVSNAVNWGIRNFRIALKVCDQTCLQCGISGCQTCPQYYNLQQLQCTNCLAGNGQSYDNSKCLACTKNCLKCQIRSKNNSISNVCILCQQGFFIYEGTCEKQPNVGNLVTQPPGNWKSSGNTTTEQGTCSVSFGAANNSNNSNSSAQTLKFLVAQDTLTNNFTVAEKHYKMLVSFYLIKIDDWNVADQLNVYLNDLLVLQKSYSSFGNKICYQQDQNDLISYEQLEIQDSNQTLTAHFQVVHAGSVSRKFGIANFNVYPVGCAECSDYDFQYKIDYNYDQSLNIQIIFNRIYVNRNQNQFKTIFELYINGLKSDYKTNGNDSVRYFISAYPDSQIILQNVTVICRYPQKVTTDIKNPVNQDPFFQGRLMQSTNKISNTKSLSNTVSTISIDRYTPVDDSSGADGLRVFFQVVSRIVIYVGFASFFIGCQTSCTHFMHNLQKIWVHIYVASLTIPSILKISLSGFRQIQNQNIAINPSGWQSGIPDQLYYEAPAQYQQYYQDITFFRNIYNVGFAAAIFLVFALLMYFIFGGNVDFSRRFTSNKFIRHMKITFYRKVYFVFNSIIFYQYLTVCLACTLQFIDLSNNTHQQPFTGINAAAAVIAFVLATLYPLSHFFYMSYKEKDMYSINYQISFRNRYHQIFYRFQPSNIWKLTHQSKPIGFTHRLYNLFRFGQIWWTCIIVALMYESPFAQAFLLMITNFFHFMIVWFSGISYTKTFKYLKMIELLFFVGLQIILLVTFSQVQTLNTESFKALGIAGVAFIFVIILCSMLRFLYTFKKIYREYDENYLKEKKMDQRLRNDDYFNSFEQDNQKIVGQEYVDTRR